jgi:hypothetical protein
LGSLGFGLYAVWRRNRKGESDAERAKRGRRAAGEALKAARAKLSAGSRDEFYATLANGMLEYVASLLGRSAKGTHHRGSDGGPAGARLFGRTPSDASPTCWSAATRFAIRPAPDSPEVRELAIGGAESILVELTLGGCRRNDPVAPSSSCWLPFVYTLPWPRRTTLATW